MHLCFFPSSQHSVCGRQNPKPMRPIWTATKTRAETVLIMNTHPLGIALVRMWVFLWFAGMR